MISWEEYVFIESLPTAFHWAVSVSMEHMSNQLIKLQLIEFKS